MTISSLLSGEQIQITAIKDHFAAVEITDADFNRIEVMGDLIRHIEIVDKQLPSARGLWGTGGCMLTLRTLAIVVTGAGVFAGLPLTDARACDDDRYPCPVRLEALTQETADVPAEPAPSAQPQKKVNHPARPNEKAQAKGEREAPRAPARAKVSKSAVQEPADSISQKAAEAAPAAVPSSRADQPLNDESRNESLVATAATPWPVLPNTEGAGASAPGVTSVDATEAAEANPVQLVDPNEVNELDRAAAATVLAESPGVTYLLLILGAALAAAFAIWFFARMTSVYARRAAGPRMYMRNS
jgi:hypothetical protein